MLPDLLKLREIICLSRINNTSGALPKINRAIQGTLVKRFRVPVEQNVYSQRSSIRRLNIGQVGDEAPPTALSLLFVGRDHIDWEILCTGHGRLPFDRYLRDARADIMMALASDTAYQTIASLLFPAEKRQG
jgi:hypothetical protein